MAPEYTFQLVELVDSDLRRMSGLVRQYADLRLGGTDASVVAICERLGIVTVATVNLGDFAAVRPRHIPAFLPPGTRLVQAGGEKTPSVEPAHDRMRHAHPIPRGRVAGRVERS